MSCSRLSAGFTRLLGDVWHGRGACARLAETPRWRVVLVECALLVLVCGGFYLARYEASARNYRYRLERISSELQAAVLDLEAERRALQEERLRHDVLSDLILDREERARLLSELTASPAHPGLEFLSVSPQPEQAVGDHVAHRVLMVLSGSFEDLARYLRRLEEDGEPCAVVGLEIESRWDKEKAERISLLIETYGEAVASTTQTGPVR